MIKREHIKQAIDAISSQNPEIGYSLDEMLGMGLIDVPAGTEDAASGEELFFLFEGEKVAVNRVLFFEQGTVPIEQGLLVKYGELVKRAELQERLETIRYQEAGQEIHTAGLKSAVTYEIDRAIARLKRKLEAAAGEGQQKGAAFYSGLVYLSMGIPVELFTPIFAVSRVSGWTARILEYLKNNRIFRPRAMYVGPFNKKYIPLTKRTRENKI